MDGANRNAGRRHNGTKELSAVWAGPTAWSGRNIGRVAPSADSAPLFTGSESFMFEVTFTVSGALVAV